MSNPPPPLPSLSEFLLDVPLYDEYTIDVQGIRHLYADEPLKFDGHCPYCHRTSTFEFHGRKLNVNLTMVGLQQLSAIEFVQIECARDQQHRVDFVIRKIECVVQKIGQFPSLADIANDESKTYRSVLTKVDSSEFHKAIGLAAHGVGIGSFVYLRRVFERLILRCFQTYKTQENWDESQFQRSRMEEKIELLKAHLPPFLVEHKKTIFDSEHRDS